MNKLHNTTVESSDQEPALVPQTTGDTALDSRLIGWLGLTAKLRGKAPLQTAIMICAKAIHLRRYNHILLTPKAIAAQGMNRVTVYRALVDLERADLIAVRRERGSSPMVSLKISPLARASGEDQATS